jgi:tricarballylate dehydrogenase
MNKALNEPVDVIVLGSGVAGLSAALSAAQAGARVAIVERAPEGEHGGNTRYTEAYLRMKSMDEVAHDFIDHLSANAGGYLDPTFIQESMSEYGTWSPLLKSHSMVDHVTLSAFADEAGPTLRWLEKAGIRFDFLPTAFLTTTTTRLLPVGGGLAIIEALSEACRKAGVAFLFDTTGQSLSTKDGAVDGLFVRTRDGVAACLRAPKIILASGGFEGNPEMLARYVGREAINLRPVARGGYYNKGEGIAMALAIGAAPNGDFGSYHAEPIDPRSGVAEPAIFTFPYGVLVNKQGERFTDEAPATVDAIYESVTRRIYEQPDGIAWLILDAKIDDVPNWRVSARTDQPPITASTLDELAQKSGIDPLPLAHTIEVYNKACRPGVFKALEIDNLKTEGLTPPKSNWARPIDKAPFLAFPVISANVFTFGGLKVDSSARVLDSDGAPIEGLYAAGETMGLYFRTYTGSTSVLRGAVFGRLAGQHAAGASA